MLLYQKVACPVLHSGGIYYSLESAQKKEPLSVRPKMTSDDTEKFASKRCLKCAYVLDALKSRKCPECGHPFDPADPSTFRTGARHDKNRWIVVSMYLTPLAITFLFWIIDYFGSAPSTLRNLPDLGGLTIGMWQATGPFAWVILNSLSFIAVITTFFGVWSAFLSLVLMTRLRNLPYAVHLFLALVWCCSGLPSVAST